MCAPDSTFSDPGFSATYRRMIETYRLDPWVQTDQLYQIMRRIKTNNEPDPAPVTDSGKRRKGGELPQ